MKEQKQRKVNKKKEEAVEKAKDETSLPEDARLSVTFAQWEKAAPEICNNIIKVRQAIAEREKTESRKNKKDTA